MRHGWGFVNDINEEMLLGIRDIVEHEALISDVLERFVEFNANRRQVSRSQSLPVDFAYRSGFISRRAQ